MIHYGGLGDISSALPKAINKLNTEIRIMIPKFDRLNLIGEDVKKIAKFSFENFGVFELYRTNLPRTDVIVYLVSHSNFANLAPYSTTSKNARYGNLYLLFSFFVAKFSNFGQWKPDIIHCNDWPTAPIAMFVVHENQKGRTHIKTILTIHNMSYQGIFHSDLMDEFDIEPKYKLIDTKEQEVNFLKMGILFSDQITTVRKTYALEIQDNLWKDGLSVELKQHDRALVGIIHGIDEDEWDPNIDKHIPFEYPTKPLKRS